jgi:hypothetical protein
MITRVSNGALVNSLSSSRHMLFLYFLAGAFLLTPYLERAWLRPFTA